jgi:hypothetical protein
MATAGRSYWSNGRQFIGYPEVRASEHTEKPVYANGNYETGQVGGGLPDTVV